MKVLLVLTLSLAVYSEAFLLPRELNTGKPVKVSVKVLKKKPEKKTTSPTPPLQPKKNPEEKLKFLLTLLEAFDSHQEFVDLWNALMKLKLPAENIEKRSKLQTEEFQRFSDPFTPNAWFKLKQGQL